MGGGSISMHGRHSNAREQKKMNETKVKEPKSTVVQVDELLTFRQFSKKAADDFIDVRLVYLTLSADE